MCFKKTDFIFYLPASLILFLDLLILLLYLLVLLLDLGILVTDLDILFLDLLIQVGYLAFKLRPHLTAVIAQVFDGLLIDILDLFHSLGLLFGNQGTQTEEASQYRGKEAENLQYVVCISQELYHATNVRAAHAHRKDNTQAAAGWLTSNASQGRTSWHTSLKEHTAHVQGFNKMGAQSYGCGSAYVMEPGRENS